MVKTIPGKILLYWHTAKHLKFIQWYCRLRNAVQSVYYVRFPARARRTLQRRLPAEITCNSGEKRVSWFAKEYDGKRGMFQPAEILRGRFTFLHCSKQFGGPVRWTNPEFSYLWDFNLHYFEYLSALAPLLESSSAEKDKAVQTVTRLLDGWVNHNPCYERPAWHPYPLSLRVIHWVKLFVNYGRFANVNTLKSLYVQLLFLERNLEKHLLANHLWENGRALLFGGLFFQGEDADRWTRIGLNILKREVHEQILPNGGHYERSPMYHCILLEGLLDTYAYLTAMDRDTAWLTPVIRKMCTWLDDITCPDGTFPLFNDAAFGISAMPREILNNASRMVGYHRSTRVDTIRDCDQFYVFDASPFFSVIDGAPIGPAYNPGHAHSDNFTYELFFKGTRLIVDAGTHHYDKDASRHISRATSSHNTVAVNGLEQSEVWGGFRVARRSNPHLSRAWRVRDFLLFQGAYTNQVDLRQRITHQRVLILKPSQWVLIWDTIQARGPIEAISHLHFAPNWHVQKRREAYRIYGDGNARVFCYPLQTDKTEVVQGHYAPEFGKKIPIAKMRFGKTGWHTVEMGYLFHTRELTASPTARMSLERDTIDLCVDGEKHTFFLRGNTQ